MPRPMRLALTFLAVALSGCAGLKPLERTDVVMVQGSRVRELISRDAHEEELAAGKGREWHDPLNARPPVLTDLESPLALKAGEYLVLRLTEGRDVELSSSEDVISCTWTPAKRVDGWSGDQAVETKESLLYVHGDKPGKGKLKLVDSTWGTHEYEVLVKPRK